MSMSLCPRSLLSYDGERLLSSHSAGTSSCESVAGSSRRLQKAKPHQDLGTVHHAKGTRVVPPISIGLNRSSGSQNFAPCVCSCSTSCHPGILFSYHQARGPVVENDCQTSTGTCSLAGRPRRNQRGQALDAVYHSMQRFDLGLGCRRLALAGLASALLTAGTPLEPVLAEAVSQPAQQESVSLCSPDLAAKLEAQIFLDLQTDLSLAQGTLFSTDGKRSLLEMAEISAEIDSRLPSDLGVGALGKLRGKDLGPEIVAASLPSIAAGLTVSGGAAVASSAAGAAASVIQPAAAALAAPTAGLSAKLATILAQAVQHFGGGGIAGAIGATVVYPLDTVKTKMQAQRKEKGDEEPEYKNELDCLLKMVKEDGVSSLYSGLGPQLLGVAPEKAVKLTVNELLLSILETFLPGARIWALEFIAGGGGGFSQVVFTNPVETVKVKLQTQQQTEGVAQKNTLQVVRELGIKGLYSGSTVTMARDIPASAIFFACYAFLKQVNPDQFFINGCVAAIPAAILVTPMDVVKTRLTVEPLPGQEAYTDAWDCVQKLVRQEGVGALFKGWGSRVLRVSPQFGITLAIYDYLSR